jgi:hypothetical protein
MSVDTAAGQESLTQTGKPATHDRLAGAGGLIFAAVFAVALVNGGPWLYVGLAGFIVWLVFVAIASISLIRGRQIGHTA